MTNPFVFAVVYTLAATCIILPGVALLYRWQERRRREPNSGMCACGKTDKHGGPCQPDA